MTDLFAARSQMAMSLGFHILFAAVGIGMPLLMVIAEGLWIRTGDPLYKALCHRWAKGTAILFAVGAVSGTALSFELGLLWPEFMALAGPIIGMPFSLEGFAFFSEAIFLGIWLYGWDKVSPRAHWAAGWAVAASGALSGAFVVCANAWMNDPQGFTMVDGVVTEIRPFEAMFNASSFPQALHMTLAAYSALGFAVAGVHAWALLKRPGHPLHQRAFGIALAVGGVAALLQPLSGHHSAQHIAEHQPVKLAAAEAHWETGPRAPALVGGWADEEAEETRYALEIPWLLSVMSFNDPDAVVMGLKDVPREDRPPVAVTHLAFDVMVGAGTLMAGVAALAGLLAWRRRELLADPRLYKLVVFASPMGMIAIEAGWVVTEVGRQPWIIRGVMRTSEAVTPMPQLQVPFMVFTALYVVLGLVVVRLLQRQVFATVDGEGAGLDAGEHEEGPHA